MDKNIHIPLFHPKGKKMSFNHKPITESYVNEVTIQSAYFLGAVCEIAYGLMIDAKDAVKHTSLYRHDLKRNVNKAIDNYMSMQHGFYRLTNFKKDYYIDFLDCYDDLAKPWVDRLKRNFINVFVRFRKESFGYEKGLMLAALNSLDIAVIIHRDFFSNFFPELYHQKKFAYEADAFNGIKEVNRLWKNAVDCLPTEKMLELSQYKRCAKSIEQLYIFAQDPQNVRKCVRKALKMHPEMLSVIQQILNENN